MPDTPRHLTCTAARPYVAVPFAPTWRSETAIALARGIVADSALDRLPILADALEEAGCDDQLVLRHCRECPHHRPHCWVLADLLDQPPVVEQPRMTDAEVRRELERVTGQPVLPPSDASWDGRLTFRMRLGQAVPVAVIVLIVSCIGWAAITPPVTSSPFNWSVPTTSKWTVPQSARP